MNWPDARVNSITSREDLARYLVELANEVRSGDLVAENVTVESLVGSAGRWTQAMDGFFVNVMREPVPERPDWAMVAAIFRAALVYE